MGGLGGRDVRREQGADWGVLRCSAGGTSNGEVRGIEAGSPVFLSTIYLKGKHQACPPCPFARISLLTGRSPTTAPFSVILRHFCAGAPGSKMVKYAPLGVQMLIKWVGLVGFVRYLVTRCLVFQYPGGLEKAVVVQDAPVRVLVGLVRLRTATTLALTIYHLTSNCTYKTII